MVQIDILTFKFLIFNLLVLFLVLILTVTAVWLPMKFLNEFIFLVIYSCIIRMIIMMLNEFAFMNNSDLEGKSEGLD